MFPVSGCGCGRFRCRRRGNALIAVAEVTVPPLPNWDVVVLEHGVPCRAWVVAGVAPIDLKNSRRSRGDRAES